MAMGADYSFELIFNETCAPQFNGHNNSFLASVYDQVPTIFFRFLLEAERNCEFSYCFLMIYQVGNTYTLNTQIFKDSLLHYHYEFEDSHYEIQD